MINYISKQAAITAMKAGHKVLHRFFASGEYIYMKKDNDLCIFFEDGNANWNDFWSFRQGEKWNNDWYIL